MASNDYDENKDEKEPENPFWLITALFAIISPISILVATATYMVFSLPKKKIKIGVLALYGLTPMLIILGIVSLFVPVVDLFISSWTVTLPNLLKNNSISTVVQIILHAMLQQSLIAIPVGYMVGLSIAWYRLKHQPAWIENEFRLTPKECFIKKRNIEDIEADKNTPYDAMTLGINDRGAKIAQTYSEALTHTLCIGASGSGKTTTILRIARDAIKSGHGVCIIDLKGSMDVPNAIGDLAYRYGKTFRHFLFQDSSQPYTGPSKLGPAYYDPIARGEATRRKDLLIEMRTWSEEYYKNEASAYLQTAFNVMIANPRPNVSTFVDLVSLLTPSALQERATPLAGKLEYADTLSSVLAYNDV